MFPPELLEGTASSQVVHLYDQPWNVVGGSNVGPIKVKKGKSLNKGANTNVHDRVMTPEPLAIACIKWAGIQAGERCYEPCCGKGAFLRNLPAGSEWAEIDQGRSFFEYNPGPVDLIITNPPYSCLGEFIYHMLHTVKPERMILLAPLTNLVTKKRLRDTFSAGYGFSRGIMIGQDKEDKKIEGFPSTGFQHVLLEYSKKAPRFEKLIW